MSTTLRWTVHDLEAFPEDGKLREIIDGELFVTTQPNIYHQVVGNRINTALDGWSAQTGLGLAATSPGVIFDIDEAVAPDVVWVSSATLAAGLDSAGHLILPPELVVEVLSPGKKNVQRDREVKLKLYARRGVQEYWIVDWPRRTVEVFRRDAELLTLAATLGEHDSLTSPLLLGFEGSLGRVFAGLPAEPAEEDEAAAG
jgi:Uma2 family endonuclease